MHCSAVFQLQKYVQMSKSSNSRWCASKRDRCALWCMHALVAGCAGCSTRTAGIQQHHMHCYGCSACIANQHATICFGLLRLTASCLAAAPAAADWHLQPCVIRKLSAYCYVA
jgi:hypothetical protein